MSKKTEFYLELAALCKAPPAPASVVFDVTTYRKACEDYQTVLHYVGEILSNYATHEKWKSQLGKGTVDDEFILQCKDNLDDYLLKLKEFVEERSKEGWE